jgi:hypothetical protein
MGRRLLSRVLPFAFIAIVLLSRLGPCQARVVSAPSEPSLLNLTSGWARASTLGDLRELHTAGDHLELRVWHGYAAAETQAMVLRRAGGHWSAFLARVIRCELAISNGVADTASSQTMRRFVVEARRNCGRSAVDVAPGSRLIATDTLIVQPLEVSEADIESAWKEAESAGVADLPARVPRKTPAGDGTNYVIELRRGDQYRASEIEDRRPPEVKADSQVAQIYAAARRLLRDRETRDRETRDRE